MEGMSTGEAARQWGVSRRHVQRLLYAGRIPGAQKFGQSWLIPSGAEKPDDPRRTRKQPPAQGLSYAFLPAADLPKNHPERGLPMLTPELRSLAGADLAFRRGDPEPAKAVWRQTAPTAETMLSAASLATAAAISSGDYGLYGELQSFLQAQTEAAANPRDKALLSLPGTLAAVGMAAPSLTPDWLKSADFSLFPNELRPFLLYLYALHLRNNGEYNALLGVAGATLILGQRAATFNWLDVYLGVLCAGAAYALGDTARCLHYLDEALELALPYGMLAPFADHLGGLGGTLEVALQQRQPGADKQVAALWDSSFKNWMRFHNDFARDNITTVLTPREYQIAHLIAHGATYALAARRMNLSVSRVKSLLADVYAKLYISNKHALAEFVL